MAVFGSSLLRKRKQGGVVSHHDSLDSNQSQSSSRVPWRRFGWILTDRVFGNSERWKLSGSVAVFDDVVFSL